MTTLLAFVLILLHANLGLSGGGSCLKQVSVQQIGTAALLPRLQIIVPRANFTCNGRITGITASMMKVGSDGTDPSVEVWHPRTPSMDVFDKIGEVQLVESEVVEEVDNNNNTYWLVNITVNDDDRIEFEAGDVVGYFHPPDTRYRVWSIETEGYRIFANEFSNALNTMDLTDKDISVNNRQPLIQFTIDIRCDILSTPFNGGMSCSSGRVGVGYEGYTCSFTCNTGYELTGSDNRTCQSNGSWSGEDTSCRKECIAGVDVYQGGDDQLRVDRQVIIPYVNCSNSDGRITHITASLSIHNNGSEYPSFQVWRPMSGDPSVYERIGDEIVLEDSEVRAMDGYWLAEIVISDNERVEFKSGDVIGCYHPSNVSYQVNTISGNGSSVHDCDGGNMTTVNASSEDANTTSINTSSGDCIANPQQPLIQVLFDIRCDILSTPSNGEISCNFDRVGVGYERDTCSFTCNTSYELTGSDTRMCQSNGCWSGSDTVCRKGGVSCFDEVLVQQKGDRRIPPQRQLISLRSNFTCNGRITGVTASMNRAVNGITDPYLEVWHPTTPDTEFNRVGAVQLAESEIVQVENCNIVYWLLNMSLNGSEIIEFEAGDVIGFYQPPDTRYQMWTIATEGYTASGSDSINSSSTLSLVNPDITVNNRQPLIQFLIDIRCDNLSTPSNGEMSCSSGRVGIGYEGDTCSFTCNTGYELTGSDTRTCQSNGNWSGSEITCKDDGTGSNDDGTTTIIVTVAVVSFFVVLISSIIVIILLFKRQNREESTNKTTEMQHQVCATVSLSVKCTTEENPKSHNLISPKKEDGVILGNPAMINNYEVPVEEDEGSNGNNPDGYLGPLFDGESEAEPDSDGYTVAHDDSIVTKPSQQYTNSGSHYQRLQSFVQPPACLTSLLAQIKETMVMEISSDSICTVKELGHGEFGVVTLAMWTDGDTSKKVAVKTLNQRASQKDKIKFFQEAALMAQFVHDNVIRMYGMVTTDPAMIILEYAKKGDLRGCLISLQPDVMEGEEVPDTVPPLLLKFAREIAAGMNYLANQGFVHRDLAARNILVTEQDICKIADFGMSRDLDDHKYYVTSGGKIPVKWTAPEALQYKKYSTFSDVWSFGCVLYEMWSLGCKPFEETPVKEILTLIDSGYRLSPPSGCPKLMYKLMIRCWHPRPKSRPAFILITKYLNKPDEELLQISDGDVQLYGNFASSLGKTLSSSSSSLNYVNSWHHELQSTYK